MLDILIQDVVHPAIQAAQAHVEQALVMSPRYPPALLPLAGGKQRLDRPAFEGWIIICGARFGSPCEPA
jgi:hypothetical protein